jgi:single-strand DNA-binding protein
MFNKIILAGNLTRDIELHYTQAGSAIANTAIATSRKFTSNGEKKEEVCFVDITFFGRSAEVANQYLHKGSKVLVEGRLKLDTWTDNNTGQKKSKHSVVVESMNMLGSKQDSNTQPSYNQQENGYQQSSNTQQNQGYQQQQAPVYEYQNAQGRTVPPPNNAPEVDIAEDDIPF